jgi:hypothetical protein
MEAHLARMEGDNKARREKMDETVAIRARTKARQEKLNANRKTAKVDIIEEMNARHTEMMAWLPDRNDTREETMACQENTEAHLEEKEDPTSEDMEAEVAHEEVPVEDAARMLVGEPRNRRKDRRNLAAGRHQ